MNNLLVEESILLQLGNSLRFKMKKRNGLVMSEDQRKKIKQKIIFCPRTNQYTNQTTLSRKHEKECSQGRN